MEKKEGISRAVCSYLHGPNQRGI